MRAKGPPTGEFLKPTFRENCRTYDSTFAWIFKNRRLVRDYEQLTEFAETLITIAASATLIRRWS